MNHSKKNIDKKRGLKNSRLEEVNVKEKLEKSLNEQENCKIELDL